MSEPQRSIVASTITVCLQLTSTALITTKSVGYIKGPFFANERVKCSPAVEMADGLFDKHYSRDHSPGQGALTVIAFILLHISSWWSHQSGRAQVNTHVDKRLSRPSAGSSKPR